MWYLLRNWLFRIFGKSSKIDAKKAGRNKNISSPSTVLEDNRNPSNENSPQKRRRRDLQENQDGFQQFGELINIINYLSKMIAEAGTHIFRIGIFTRKYCMTFDESLNSRGLFSV